MPKTSMPRPDDNKSCGAKIQKITILRANDYSRRGASSDNNGQPPVDTDENEDEKDEDESDNYKDEEEGKRKKGRSFSKSAICHDQI